MKPHALALALGAILAASTHAAPPDEDVSELTLLNTSNNQTLVLVIGQITHSEPKPK
jgi:hypothetical protein